MIENTLVLICENMATSQEKNLSSYFNCFDGLTFPQFPSFFSPFFLCSQWRKTIPEDFFGYTEISLKDPNGKDILPILKDEVILKQEFHRINVSFGPIRFDTPGNYVFRIDILDSKRKIISYAQKAFNVKQGSSPQLKQATV